MSATDFDAAYYERFYKNPRTRVVDRHDVARLSRFVCHYLVHLGQPVRRVLDIGCGLGLWRPVVAECFPSARYTGVEVSDHLCDELGWERGSVVDYRARRPFDLVVCQGVLQYLGHRDARAAIDNLAELCRGALYLEALTTEDWEHNCDRRRTDGSVHLRRAAWYRQRLRPHFVNCGGGVFLSRTTPHTLFELEIAPG